MSGDGDREPIRALSMALLDAVNNADTVGVLAVWADDGVMMPPHRPSVHGRHAIEDYFRRLFATTRLRFVFTSSDIIVDGDLAVERVDYEAQAWRDGAADPIVDAGKGVHVFRRAEDGWKLTFDIWNSTLA